MNLSLKRKIDKIIFLLKKWIKKEKMYNNLKKIKNKKMSFLQKLQKNNIKKQKMILNPKRKRKYSRKSCNKIFLSAKIILKRCKHPRIKTLFLMDI